MGSLRTNYSKKYLTLIKVMCTYDMFNCFAALAIIYKAALTLLKVATESADFKV